MPKPVVGDHATLASGHVGRVLDVDPRGKRLLVEVPPDCAQVWVPVSDIETVRHPVTGRCVVVSAE